MERYKKFEQIAKYWLSQLEKYNEEPIKLITEFSPWSISMLFDHMFTYNEQLCFLKIQECIDSTDLNLKKGKKFSGIMVFTFQKFLGKAKDSSLCLTNPPQNQESLMFIRNRMIKNMKMMSELSHKINLLPKEKLKNKAEHPTLGFLNIEEWYSLVTIHMYHHIITKEKIDQHFMK